MSHFKQQAVVISEITSGSVEPASAGDMAVVVRDGRLETNDGTTTKNIAFDFVSSPVSITEATTLTTAFDKLHVISGTTADYTVTLPAVSGNANKIISFRIAHDATRFFTIKADGSELIDGLNERVMWQSESATLLCDGSRWTKIAGRSRPLKVVARRSASALLAGDTDHTLVFQTLDEDSRSSSPIASLFYSTTTGLFTAPRTSQYGCQFHITSANAARISITRGGVARSDNPNIHGLSDTDGTISISGYWGLTQAQNIRGVVRYNTQTGLNITTGFLATFTVTEIPEW